MPDPATTQMISSQGGTTSPPEPDQFQAYHVPTDQQPQGSGVMRFLHGMAMAHLGLAGEEYRQQQEQKRNEAQILSSIALQHPEVAQSEDFMKTLAKSTSPNFANAIGMFAQSAAMQRKEAVQAMPSMQQGGMTQTAVDSHLSEPDAIRQHIEQVHQFAAQHPENQYIQERAQQEIGFRQKQLEEVQKQQDIEATRSLKQQQQASTDEYRKAELELRQQAEQTAQSEREQHNQEMEAIAHENSDSKKQQMIGQLGKNLDTSRDKILADFSKAPSTGFKARVEGYNASAQQFYSKHAGSGAPTLLKYSEEPSTVQTYSLGYAGSPNPKIEAVPPTYGEYKGKSGWKDADNNFYADGGTDQD